MIFYDVLTQQYKDVPVYLMTPYPITRYVYDNDIALGSVIPETPTFGTPYPERGFYDRKCMMMVVFCSQNYTYKIHAASYLSDSSVCMFSTYLHDQLIASYMCVSFKNSNVISLFIYTGVDMRLYNIELFVLKSTTKNIVSYSVHQL